MSIWWKEIRPEDLNITKKANMVDHLGITITEIGSDYIVGKMPVDHRTIQPFGILHGGASCVLAETLGSIAGNLTIDPSKYQAVGLSLNANYIRPILEGHTAIGKAVCQHRGKSTQIWEIEIKDESHHKTTCLARLTLAVRRKIE